MWSSLTGVEKLRLNGQMWPRNKLFDMWAQSCLKKSMIRPLSLANSPTYEKSFCFKLIVSPYNMGPIHRPLQILFAKKVLKIIMN